MFGIISILLALLGFFCTGDLCYAYCRNQYNSNLLIKTIEKGTRPELDDDPDNIFPWSEIVNHVKRILQPDKNHSFYHLICGEHGTGKTILIKIAAREVGCGIVYVDVPFDVEDFVN